VIRFLLRDRKPRRSFRGAGLRTGIGNARDYPSSVHTDQIEQICSAVIDLPIDQKVERCPHHGEIAIDPDALAMREHLSVINRGNGRLG
jgi:hypothetical protein